MTEYVVGFCFTADLSTVWLIRKKRPDWQAGKLNGIGGHIEEGETPKEAMEREFHEEAGLFLDNWEKFAVLEDRRKWRVHFFRIVLSVNRCVHPHTKTDEEVLLVPTRSLPSQKEMIPNLSWLIPMALEAPFGMRYEVREDTTYEK